MTSETSVKQFPTSSTNSNGTLLNSNPLIASSIQNSFSSASSGSNVLKLSNLPSDLTKREATIIFSLVIDDIVNIEIQDYKIFAYFKNMNTCLATGKLLDGKYIFGNEYGPIKVEYDNLPINSPTSIASSTTSAFNSLRLTSTNISPPSINSQSQPPATTSSSNTANTSNAPNFDNFQKRQSIGNQRSRFVFSDPFSGSATPSNNPASSGAPGGIDLTDITGKSLLLMESHNDAREYENLVRDPWGSSNNSLPINSAPQTPSINSSTHTPFDWTNNPASSTTNSASDRRRTSSAFFNNNSLHPLSAQSSSSTLLGSQQPTSQSQSTATQPSANGSAYLPQLSIQSHNQVGIHPSAPANSQTQSTNIPTPVQNINQTSQQPSTGQHPSGPSAQQSGQPPSSSQSQSVPSASVTSTTSTNQPSNSRQAPSSKDVPDLSLLARVPPPANPADQNPPCNTLYVGNLPPDATEAELRSLFSPQKGFRRLSFRTKNQSSSNPNSSSSHNHGPMCFVEFEDVAHATRALAELYGRALPRPNGGNGKGGIRLSFSKNPLGVRGPGNPRRSTTNQASSNSSTSNNTNNGVGNYGYSSYHQK